MLLLFYFVNFRLEQIEYIQVIHYSYTVIILIMRMLCISFFASQIHDESKKPITILFNTPLHKLTFDSKQIHEEIHCNMVALSGMEFFFITRPMILSIVGVICSYEIILYNFI